MGKLEQDNLKLNLGYRLQKTRKCILGCSLSNLYEEGIIYNLPFRKSLREMLEFEFGTPQILPAEHRCKNQTAVSTAQLIEPNDDIIFRVLRYTAGEKESKKILGPADVSEYIDLSPYCGKFNNFPCQTKNIDFSFVAADSRNKSQIFRLKGTVNHISDASEGDNGGGGHYVAYTRT